MMLFNSIKEINRLGKEINRLLSKGMSNIIEETLPFNFLSSKDLSPVQFWGVTAHADIIGF